MDQREFYWVRVKGELWNSLAVATTDEKEVRHFHLPGRLFGLYEGQVEVVERIPAPCEPLTSEAEDAGGFMLRAVRKLFGLSSPKASVITYQQAARAMVRRAA
ncbi:MULTISPECIES: hypothetical protein [Methylobacterium]|uniref:Protein of unassigned function n=2 Tax=Methylobacterium TaxID=407 RepID=A0A089NS62_9HYPH|nr:MULTISPECIES: hypothetical protein [Methylobacterium]ACB24645.1 hypothetical protein Mrad2831_2661 [Methylobacterium radiotolerans JCM 2831]AIQ90781.1 protein of unassigned function [Methylobacterium oryzae CBMB20]GEM97081.1 hypothetical protein MRA01_16210 [Methylobacterium radiotolerans]